MVSDGQGEVVGGRALKVQQLLLASQSSAASTENEDNLIRVIIAIFGTLSSVGTLTAGVFATWLALRVYRRGLERATLAATQSGDPEGNAAETNLQQLETIAESESR